MKNRKIKSSLFWIFSVLPVTAQNLQLHGDFGSNLYKDDFADRTNLNATIEMFKADNGAARLSLL